MISTTTPNLEVKYTIEFTEAAPNIIIDEVGGLYLKESDITVSGGTLKPGSLRLLDNETKLEIVVAVKSNSMDNLKIAIGRNTELNIKGEIVSAIIPEILLDQL